MLDAQRVVGYLRIPIVDQRYSPLGMLYARHALQALLGEVEYEEDLLRDYGHRISLAADRAPSAEFPEQWPATWNSA